MAQFRPNSNNSPFASKFLHKIKIVYPFTKGLPVTVFTRRGDWGSQMHKTALLRRFAGFSPAA
jgi:hypothetical protein